MRRWLMKPAKLDPLIPKLVENQSRLNVGGVDVVRYQKGRRRALIYLALIQPMLQPLRHYPCPRLSFVTSVLAI